MDEMPTDPPGAPPPEPSEVTDPAGHEPRSRRRLLLGILAVVAVAAAALAVTRPWAGPAPAPSTTTATTTTTVKFDPWPATVARIATARSSTVAVQQQPPPGWSSMEPVDTWDNPAPPSSQATMPPRPELPRSDLPIQGRYVSATGWTFNNPTTWGDPFVMLVTERRGNWLKVEIPVRPNGTPGYVAVSDVTLSSTDYHLDLRLGTRTLTLYQGTTPVLSTQVVVGKPETHTPTGRFYITEKVEQTNPAGAYGPVILPTNAYSEQIDEFDSGVPVIALHGTNQPELIGQNVSNGCVRIPNDQITKIASLIPAGTPIDIAA